MPDNRAIANAVERWSEELIDIGGRNRLLFYKPLRSGTVDFRPNEYADQYVVERLLDGESVRLSDAVPNDERIMRRGRAIRQKSREHEEEQGIRTLHLGRYLASWLDKPGREPAAPIFLSAVEIKALGRLGDDFELARADDWELNPSLLHYLRTEFQVQFDEEALQEGVGNDQWDQALALFRSAAAEVPELEIADRVVMATFSYAKLPLVRDLEGAHEAIGKHQLVAALTGDPGARDELRSIPTDSFGDDENAIPDDPRPQDEYLILDADGSQSRVINAALQGRHLVVVGPPGTGKSQTIANLIATLAARGKSTLFVAEKRAAIDAVTKRLQLAGLEDLVLDLHEGVQSRRRTAEQLAKALDTVRRSTVHEVETTHRQLTRSRDELSRMTRALHQIREPWGVSVYDIYQGLASTNSADGSAFRLYGSVVRALTPDRFEAAAEELVEFIQLGGTQLEIDHNHPWSAAYRAKRINTREQCDEVLQALDDVRTKLLHSLEAELSRIGELVSCGLPERPADVADWLDVFDGLGRVLDDVYYEAFEADLEQLVADLQPTERSVWARALAVLFNSRYRQAKLNAAKLVRSPQASTTAVRDSLREALQCRSTWRAAASDAVLPAEPPGTADARAALKSVETELDLISDRSAADESLLQLSWNLLDARLEGLAQKRYTLARLPQLRELRNTLSGYGLAGLVNCAVDEEWDPVGARELFRLIWFRSLLDEVRIRDRDLDRFNAAGQTRAVVSFAESDREHVRRSPTRVRRAWAEAVIAARNEHPDQEVLIVRQSKRRRPRPMRELVRRAPDVLTALKPCWAMSPLLVPQILPREQLFDVVIFDEASQILPADAVSSLLRGRQAVVAGDPKQLPPTTFFTSTSDDYEDEEEQDDDGAEFEHGPLTNDVESVLDAVSTLMPGNSRTLNWHYRSLDERLIGFSNHHIYERSLTTFPGLLQGDCVAHVEVPPSHDSIASGGSNSAEVRQVVDLILEHAERRPDESLGVIAFGLKHAHRIEETLRFARQENPDLDEFFSDERDEPFFVKNLERVQGDEREAIILTVGYGRAQDGRMRYNFGPLNREGGYRRLNVAVTRAKRRMTVVSAFSAADMEPDRLGSQGPQMLRDYIAYAASAGHDLGSARRDAEPLNPFEIDIKNRLEAEGVPLQPRYGASGYSIDFAAMHPDQPGQPVLAIEADGVRYHSAINARERDRLRQEHLERLGWRFHRIWSTEWFRNPEAEVAKVVVAWREAVAEADRVEAEPRVSEPAPVLMAVTAASPDVSPQRRRECPHVVPGQPIIDYHIYQLDDIVRWARSDGLLHTDEELIRTIARAMGYQRVGSRIRGLLQAAIVSVDREADRDR